MISAQSFVLLPSNTVNTIGRSIMLSKRANKLVNNKHSFCNDYGLPPVRDKIFIRKKMKIKNKKGWFRDIKDMEKYRQLKTGEQFWRKNINPEYPLINQSVLNTKKKKSTENSLVKIVNQNREFNQTFLKEKENVFLSPTKKRAENLKNNCRIKEGIESEEKSGDESGKIMRKTLSFGQMPLKIPRLNYDAGVN